jgi:hypothetical protein
MYNAKSVLYSTCLLLFIDTISAGLIFPILPAFFINQEYGLLKNDLYFSKEILYGLSFVMFPLSTCVFGS